MNQLLTECRLMHQLFLQQLAPVFERPLLSKIEWSERLIGLLGARGAGKTTLLLQYLLKQYGTSEKALYVSLDSLSFNKGDLYDLAEKCWQQGVEFLVLDEVHKFETWSQEMKKVNDLFPKMQVVFTSSSLLHLMQGNADLSRRAVVYHLDGLSFREYVQIESGLAFDTITLPDLLQNHVDIASDICKKIKPMMYFKQYLPCGFYPYYLQNRNTYKQKLMATILQMLEFDIPYLRGVEIRYVNKLKQLLHTIAQNVPFKPNVVQLADAIGISRQAVLLYLHHLQDANLIKLLYPHGAVYSKLKKPEKVYLWHPNLIFTLEEKEPDVGNIRETFFLQQLNNGHAIHSAPMGDFLVDNTYLFEIGGKNKNAKQIKNLPNSFVAADDMEIGFDRQIPLWLFGWLS
jgi:predicted AAA+ superfamily ATPase